jgi:hypothetical protein
MYEQKEVQVRISITTVGYYQQIPSLMSIITNTETNNQSFWICYHAVMLFLHGVITKEDFDKIYKQQTLKQ